MTTLTAALAYAAHGWAVLPIRPGAKTPLTAHGVRDASKDPTVIRAWWAKWPDANVGIATGRASGLWVLDIDPPHGGDDSLAKLEAEHGELEPHLLALTPSGGQHLPWALGDAVVACRIGIEPGIDVRGDGGYVVAPPSQIDSEHRWCWEALHDPEELGYALTAAPAWLLERVVSRGLASQRAAPLPERIPYGQRHAALVSLAGSMRHRGASEDAIAAALEAEIPRCDGPPVPPGNIRAIARSVATLYSPATNGTATAPALEAARAIVAALPDATKLDPGAPYEPDAVAALRLLDRHEPGEYERARKDLKAAGARMRRLDRAVRGAEPRRAPTGREIIVRPQIGNVVDEAEDALLDAGAELYGRAGQLVRVTVPDSDPRASWLHRPPQHPIVEAVPEAALREQMATAAVWLQPQKDDAPFETLPPGWAVQTLAARGRWRFRSLEGIALAPCLRPDGSVLSTPGYDDKAGLYLTTGSEPVSQPDPAAAIAVLLGALDDFPFVGESDRSAALAAMLTLAARPAIDGPCPLFAVSSPTPGTGKTLLCEAVSIAMTGRGLARMQPGRTDEEEDKRILAICSEGLPAVLLDNIEGPLGSAPLAAVLTGTSYRGRVLGQTRTIEVPSTAIWFAAGNNLQYRGDTYRRVVPISLDAGCESPEERSGWRHDPLVPWLRAEHPRLVGAALACLTAYHAAGRPQAKLPPYGSYEAWSALVRQCCVWLGLPDPCVGRSEIRASSDPDAERRRSLFGAWYTVTDQPITVADLVRRSADYPELRDALIACARRPSDHPEPRAVGRALAQWRGRIEGGLRLDRISGDHARRTSIAPTWRVAPIGAEVPAEQPTQDEIWF